MPDRLSASCRFDGCSESLIGRVVLALVDQMCADADIDIALLDALDYPLGESLSALHEFGIRSVTVGIEHRKLTIDINLAAAVPDAEELLGESTDVVESFFDVRRADGALGVALIGSLG